MPQISPPYLMFLGDVPDQLAAKTAQGVVDWRPEWVLGQMRLDGCGADLGVPDMGLAEAREAGARTFVIGAVNAGGVLPDHWIETAVEAARAGMDIASGLHVRLSSVPEIAAAAAESGVALHDLRAPSRTFATGKGTPRTGKRLLAVGTDCSVGKKYAALALERDMRAAGFDADFRATGQTGILIAGRGVAIDAVVADFIAGAAEWLSPDADPDHWDVIEGQGSLFHPSFAGVTLGLLHGSQPDVFVVCHDPSRTSMIGLEGYALPSIEEVIDLTIRLGSLTNPAIRCAGISMNTSSLGEAQAGDVLASESERLHGMPVADPMRGGRPFERLLDACLV